MDRDFQALHVPHRCTVYAQRAHGARRIDDKHRPRRQGSRINLIENHEGSLIWHVPRIIDGHRFGRAFGFDGGEHRSRRGTDHRHEQRPAATAYGAHDVVRM